MAVTAYPELVELPETDDELNRHLEYLERRIGHLEGQLAPMKARIAKLENRAADFRYVGVWRAGAKYKVGNFTTDRGSLWHAERETRSRPGCGDGSWRLCVKSGAFAK